MNPGPLDSEFDTTPPRSLKENANNIGCIVFHYSTCIVNVDGRSEILCKRNVFETARGFQNTCQTIIFNDKNDYICIIRHK